MKRYLVFTGEDHYPVGGWEDFKGAYDTLEEARASAVVRSKYEWSHIVDTESMEMVENNG